MLKLLAIALLGYVFVLAAIYFAQTGLIFPARMVGPAPPLPTRAERIELTTPTGERLRGVRLPPIGVADPAAPVLLVFPGNAWNAEDAALMLHGLFPAGEVIAFHYRGYAPSEGRPSAAALTEDAALIYDSVASSRPTVAVGFSIGSGIASHLASRRPLAGVILVTPFDSLAKVAAGHYRWLPAGLLLRHRLDPADDLRASNVPVALITAGRDTLIPPARARALADTVPNLVFDHTIAGAGHNDLYQHPRFAAAMRDALARIAL